MKSPLLLTGIGLRPPHYADFLLQRPEVAWVEVHTDNYLVEGGKPLHVLEQIRKQYPVSFHGVNLSLGSVDELNWAYLKKIRELMQQIEPCLLSDHLAWSHFDGQYFHDLLPLPYTEECLALVVSRIQAVQTYLNRALLIENISSYVSYTHSTIPEPEFLTAMAKQSGCGLLLDITNIYVTASHAGWDPQAYVRAIPADCVQEVHLAGYSEMDIGGQRQLVDTHSQPVTEEVWTLYRYAIEQWGRKPTIIEWDTNLPTLETLCAEAEKAEQIMKETYAVSKLAG